jgi:hypothetical protein
MPTILLFTGPVIEKAVNLREANETTMSAVWKHKDGGSKSAIPELLQIPTLALYLWNTNVVY